MCVHVHVTECSHTMQALTVDIHVCLSLDLPDRQREDLTPQLTQPSLW